MSDIVKNVIAALIGAAILALVAWIFAGYKGFIEDLGKISDLESAQILLKSEVAKQGIEVDSLQRAGFLTNVSLSLGDHQIRDLAIEYTAKSAGFVIASVESLGPNNHGVICGYIDNFPTGKDLTKVSVGSASVFRKGNTASTDEVAYLPLSSFSMVVDEGQKWKVNSCGGKQDDNFRSRITWIPISVITK